MFSKHRKTTKILLLVDTISSRGFFNARVPIVRRPEHSIPCPVPPPCPTFPQELGSTKQKARGFSRGPDSSRAVGQGHGPRRGVGGWKRAPLPGRPRGLTRQSPLPPFCRGIVFLTISTLSSPSMRLAPFPLITIFFSTFSFSFPGGERK